MVALIARSPLNPKKSLGDIQKVLPHDRAKPFLEQANGLARMVKLTG